MPNGKSEGNIMRKKPLVFGLGVFGGVFLLIRQSQKISDGGLGGLDDARRQRYTMPERWWQKDPSRGRKNCYTSKVEALQRFADYNSQVIENYSGIAHVESPSEFDSLNHHHSLHGTSRAIVNIAQALWVAMPPGRPYCLDQIDIERLNDSSPGREAIETLGVGFAIPDYASEYEETQKQVLLWRQQKKDNKAQRKIAREAMRRERKPKLKTKFKDNQIEVPF